MSQLDTLNSIGEETEFMIRTAANRLYPYCFYSSDSLLYTRLDAIDLRHVRPYNIDIATIRRHQLGFNYLSPEIANHDFGVPADKATVKRPAYQLDSTTSVEAGVGLFIEITRDWLFVMDANLERFSDEVVNSPIVDQDYVIKGFAAINYVF